MKQMVSMSADEKALMIILCENQVPLKWRKIWTGPKLATDYLRAVTSRANSAENRLKMDSHVNFTSEIDFISIFNIEGFFAALKLANARELEKSACDLTLNVTFGGISQNKNYDNKNIFVTVKPLVIDGAYFENDKLQIPKESNEKFNDKSPSFEVTFIEMKTKKILISETYDLPLYTNANREKLIANLPIQIFSDCRDAIIYSGAAFIVPDF